MWDAIALVTSGITLIAFLAAVGTTIYLAKIRQLGRMIEAAPEKDRAALVERALEFFRVDTTGLTKEQQYTLALLQIKARAARFLTTAIVVVIITVVAAAVAVYAMARDNRNGPTPPPLTLVLDSRVREAALGDVVRALEPLEREGLTRVEATVLTSDQAIAERLAERRPALVVIHVHAFSESVGSSDEASDKLISLLRAFDERNGRAQYIVYSGYFASDPSGGPLWLARMVERNTFEGGQMSGYRDPFLDRIRALGLPNESPLPQTAREALRRVARTALTESRDG